MEVALVAEDVGTAFRSVLEARAAKVAEPETKPWGQTVAYVGPRVVCSWTSGAGSSWLAVSVAVS